MDILGVILLFFGAGILIAYPLVWIVGFIFLNNENFKNIKNRLRIVVAIIIGIWLYNLSMMPNAGDVTEMIQKWYPKAKNIKINTITKSKIESNTYYAYVNFGFTDKSSNCRIKITIRRSNKFFNYFYDYSTKGYTCY